MLQIRFMLLPALALPGLLLTGCGEGSDDSDARAAGGDDATAVMTAHLDALGDADYAAACDLYSPAYRDQVLAEWNANMAEGDGAKDCPEAMESITGLFRMFAEAPDANVWLYEDLQVEVDGDTATAGFVMSALDDTSDYLLERTDGRWFIVGISDDEGEGGVPDTDVDVQSGAVGDTFDLGDWLVTVTEVDVDADEVIASSSELNTAPQGRYVLITFDAVYEGDAPTGQLGDVMWKVTDAAQHVHHQDGFVAATPAHAEGWETEAQPGEVLTSQAVFDLDPDLLAGAVVGIEYVDADLETYGADIRL